MAGREDGHASARTFALARQVRLRPDAPSSPRREMHAERMRGDAQVHGFPELQRPGVLTCPSSRTSGSRPSS
eukprot:684440-Pyramimonas_sp.AAC.1